VTHPDDLLSAYLDGEVWGDERATIAEHLAACEGCRRELAEVAEARAQVRGLPLLEPPPGLVPAPASRPRPFLRRRWAWAASAAAAAVIVVGIVLGGGGETAPAIDLGTLAERHTARVVVDPGIATIRATVGSP
jgi:predicted anti-sigma-YlaC factor YlaD